MNWLSRIVTVALVLFVPCALGCYVATFFAWHVAPAGVITMTRYVILSRGTIVLGGAVGLLVVMLLSTVGVRSNPPAPWIRKTLTWLFLFAILFLFVNTVLFTRSDFRISGNDIEVYSGQWTTVPTEQAEYLIRCTLRTDISEILAFAVMCEIFF